jgi:hypothetical protein
MNGKNLIFETDPFAFASANPINPLNMKPSNITPQNQAKSLTHQASLDRIRDAYFDLEPISAQSREVNLRAVFPGTEYVPQGLAKESAIHCYWVPYRSHGVQGSGIANVPYVDLPTANPTYNIMLTGAMNGCSLVVTQPANVANTIRVYHDSKHEANTFNGITVSARLDFDQQSFNSPYFYGDASNPTSFNFMYFKNGHWWVVSQPQSAVASAAGYSVSLRSSKLPFEFQVT